MLGRQRSRDGVPTITRQHDIICLWLQSREAYIEEVKLVDRASYAVRKQ